MSERTKYPAHGTIVVESMPSRKTRRRWCDICSVWTWEVAAFGGGVFRHGRGSRSRECRKRRGTR